MIKLLDGRYIFHPGDKGFYKFIEGQPTQWAEKKLEKKGWSTIGSIANHCITHTEITNSLVTYISQEEYERYLFDNEFYNRLENIIDK